MLLHVRALLGRKKYPLHNFSVAVGQERNLDWPAGWLKVKFSQTQLEIEVGYFCSNMSNFKQTYSMMDNVLEIKPTKGIVLQCRKRA